MLVNAVNPLLNAFVTLSASHIKHNDDAPSLFVEVVSDLSEFLLTSCVPDLNWNFDSLLARVVYVSCIDCFKSY